MRLIPAARVTLVGSDRAAGALPPTIVALTIAPPPRSRMIGTTARHSRTAAISFSSMSAYQASSPTSSRPRAAEVPALLTRMSTPPKAAMAASTKRRQSSARLTSATMGTDSPPVAWRSSAADLLQMRRPAGADRDPGAGRREPRRGRPPEPVAAARDQRHLAAKLEIHRPPSLCPTTGARAGTAAARTRSCPSPSVCPTTGARAGGRSCSRRPVRTTRRPSRSRFCHRHRLHARALMALGGAALLELRVLRDRSAITPG